MTAGLEQRCWNHEDREAVCRCPECGRSFCRECVSEHQSRLLCAACLARAAEARQSRRSPLRPLAIPLLAFAGIVLAWLVLFGAGESLLILAERAEQASWQSR
jgi:hypothetical protein